MISVVKKRVMEVRHVRCHSSFALTSRMLLTSSPIYISVEQPQNVLELSIWVGRYQRLCDGSNVSLGISASFIPVLID